MRKEVLENILTDNNKVPKPVSYTHLDVNGKTYTIRELASQEMKNSAGATWDAATAGNAIGTWSASFGAVSYTHLDVYKRQVYT